MSKKEQAVKDYIEVIKKSWSWERLTEKEKVIFLDYLNLPSYLPQGTYDQAWKTAQNYYMFYLHGISQVDTKRFE